MATDEELLTACKVGLNISPSSTSVNGVISQKIQIVKAFMLGAGVKEENLTGDLALGVIVVGVTDIWNLTSGTIKFSPVFTTLLVQLACKP